MALIKIDGTEMPLDDEIAKDDETLKKALSPFYPGAANSDIKRTTENGQMVVTVVKRAGSKGGDIPIIEALKAAPEHINPAIKLANELQRKESAGALEITEIMEMTRVVEQAINTGRKEEGQVEKALALLHKAPPCASSVRPMGF